MRSAIVLIMAAACGGARPAPRPAQPPYASATSLSSPQLFAPGAISTADPEFAITFSPDGATAYFDRANADRSKLVIMSSTFSGGAWQPAASLPFSTGAFRDVDPFAVGNRVYFSSDRPHPGDEDIDFDTWYVARNGASWSDPSHVKGAPSGHGNQVFVTIARDGTLYFQSDSTGGGDIYRAPLTSRGYGIAAPLEGISTPGSESNPAISPDGTLLVFVSDREGGQGGADLYATRWHDGAWSPPVNLARANSSFADFAPAFSPDGAYLFFTSERPGIAPTPATGRPPGDIYQIDVAAIAP